MSLRTQVLLLVLAAGAVAQTPAVEEQPALFHVRPERTFQTIAGFGAGAFEGNVVGQLAAADAERLYNLLYTNRGTNLNIIRFVVPPTAGELLPDDPLRKQGILYDWAADQDTQTMFRSLPPILARTKPLVYVAPFSPPARWKSDRQLNWGGVLNRDRYADYGAYVADFLRYCTKVRGLKVDVLSLQNEPDVAAPWPSCRWTGEELRDFLKILGPLVEREHLSTRLILPEGSSWDQTAMKMVPILVDPAARKFVNILASHSYGWDDIVDRGRDLVREAAGRENLPVWMSEMSIIGPPDDPSMAMALKIAHYMYRDFVEANASAWIYCFSIFIPDFSGSMGILSPVKNGRFSIPKRFWAFANYSRFVQPGWKRIEVDGLSFANSAFISPQGDRFAIVALNASGHPRPATYDFGSRQVHSVEAFRTSAQSDLAAAGGVTVIDNGFRVTLAPISITTLIGRL